MHMTPISPSSASPGLYAPPHLLIAIGFSGLYYSTYPRTQFKGTSTGGSPPDSSGGGLSLPPLFPVLRHITRIEITSTADLYPGTGSTRLRFSEPVVG
eukprot:2742126-Rhodomonas_salina.2